MQNAKLRNKFKFLPDIATADLAFEAFGKDASELFENAGLALESAMVESDSLKTREVKEINLKNENLENLLSSFLEELVFLKDSEQLLFNSITCEIRSESNSRKNSYELESKLGGEKINHKKHKLGVDVKAVTKHLFKIEQLGDKTYHCLVVLDV
ncbi:hypothetical protein A2715_04450 [Candidatus Woesebacteria bacterium RIFCSPHIGHO2_01_FULL_39_32]|uniref:Archease domain-containing protein n=2 Tax=Candidatus Woeseibacteriota TaxID=1752722 RepID=A0A0G0PZE9_9BACT|nr:MAG: hypothetical protein UT61_C0006G0022 [Candidatus Woesebacteria bacterium GW2011_GWA1_39_8]OGM04241.1 MAG: hypothetical protein A2124_05460 [Candidatus Woesebacteria bacterium GWB1_37_5]OGM25269.1 MAG: hypothetical protein A2715_04450 [Candidatus Woesebacteria bacterium RIFCSPHIGHO2_01_FULL_39_32]OGM37769.1 MAG: hypothetical protein A3F01_01660 [Candidatus Woesebacteria bacterium RIFCSPHIGHO2_12_FULL_38_11]OGM64800.1 MAG: hypothetical protein A2893_04060 [Candidatus Woesebacteria bacteri